MRKNITTHIFRALIAVIVLLISSSITVYAANYIPIIVDSEEIYMDVPARIINDRTMIPVRAVTEAVGCTVEWYAAEQRVVINSPAGGDPLIIMEVGNKTVTVNSYNGATGDFGGKRVTIDSPPIIIDGRTLVPLRFIAETIGFTVEWDNGAVFLYSGLNNDGRGDFIPDSDYNGFSQWWGTYVNSGYSLDINSVSGESFYYVIRMITTTQNTVVSEGWAYIDESGLFAMSGEMGFSLYEDFSAIDIFVSESSEWADLRGQYELIGR